MNRQETSNEGRETRQRSPTPSCPVIVIIYCGTIPILWYAYCKQVCHHTGILLSMIILSRKSKKVPASFASARTSTYTIIHVMPQKRTVCDIKHHITLWYYRRKLMVCNSLSAIWYPAEWYDTGGKKGSKGAVRERVIKASIVDWSILASSVVRRGEHDLLTLFLLFQTRLAPCLLFLSFSSYHTSQYSPQIFYKLHLVSTKHVLPWNIRRLGCSQQGLHWGQVQEDTVQA